jgi:hypothetical protein
LSHSPQGGGEARILARKDLEMAHDLVPRMEGVPARAEGAGEGRGGIRRTPLHGLSSRQEAWTRGL